MVGRVTGANSFEPKHALIVQNKDKLEIPLLLETLPTPKEFKDSIQSLSPEQQQFCRGWREMQLESTLLGICVVQIKPALERVLNLTDDSLTKELVLTQDLLKLFVDYQVPADQMRYNPNLNPNLTSVNGSQDGKVAAAQDGKVAAAQDGKVAAAQDGKIGAANEIAKIRVVRGLVDAMLTATGEQQRRDDEARSSSASL